MPLLVRPLLVWYSTRMAVMWMELGCNWCGKEGERGGREGVGGEESKGGERKEEEEEKGKKGGKGKERVGGWYVVCDVM